MNINIPHPIPELYPNSHYICDIPTTIVKNGTSYKLLDEKDAIVKKLKTAILGGRKKIYVGYIDPEGYIETFKIIFIEQ